MHAAVAGVPGRRAKQGCAMKCRRPGPPRQVADPSYW